MPGAQVLWPERESLYALMLLRATIGAATFESEKNNNPVDPEACEWPPEYFNWPGFFFDRWPSGDAAQWACKTIAVDPSKGKDSDHGDYSAIVRYGVTWQGVEYVEADLARRTVDRICVDTAAHVAAFEPDGLYLEAIAFQELMAAPMQTAMEAAGVVVTLHLDEDTTNKIVRIRRLTEPLCQRRLRFKARSPKTTLCVQQFQDFPNGDHDDGPDAVEKARRLAIKLIKGKSTSSTRLGV